MIWGGRPSRFHIYPKKAYVKALPVIVGARNWKSVVLCCSRRKSSRGNNWYYEHITFHIKYVTWVLVICWCNEHPHRKFVILLHHPTKLEFQNCFCLQARKLNNYCRHEEVTPLMFEKVNKVDRMTGLISAWAQYIPNVLSYIIVFKA